MSLTHVCVWDPDVGYRRISASEASALYPRHTVSAHSGIFVCELCAQNVCFTAPGLNARHFRHDSAEQNKTCEDRQQAYEHAITSLTSPILPIRITVKDGSFRLELGFFALPHTSGGRPQCEKIKIRVNANQHYEYSFERIEAAGITYLDIGSQPSSKYQIEYTFPSPELKKFWPSSISGINAKGSFFDATSGKILYSQGKAYANQSYYLLQQSRLYSYEVSSDISVQEISHVQVFSYGTSTWYLYKIRAKRFSASAARFFLQRSIFLTESPAKFYPIWPVCKQAPYFIYHNQTELFFYLSGSSAELKLYPTLSSRSWPFQSGKLIQLHTSNREQLLSLGASGALGVSYLIRQNISSTASAPIVKVTDTNSAFLDQDVYFKLPKEKRISILAPFDGKVAILRNGRLIFLQRLSAGECTIIDALSLGTELQIYQGCDCVRVLHFEREKHPVDSTAEDDALLQRLLSCQGSMVSVPHSLGAIATSLTHYPKVRQWLYATIRKGEISQSAYRLLIHYLESTRRVNHAE